jgi:serine/threonine-protein kinase RsbW
VERELWLRPDPGSIGLARAAVREIAAQSALAADAAWAATLAVSEAVTNAVQHGAPCGPAGIRLIVEVDDGVLRLEICDCGGYREAGSSDDPLPEHGRGERLLRALMDDVLVAHEASMTRIVLSKRLVAC